MATTIQVSDSTKQLLEKLKKEEKVNSYDEIIQELLFARTKVSKSMFGADRTLTWTKKDRMVFHER